MFNNKHNIAQLGIVTAVAKNIASFWDVMTFYLVNRLHTRKMEAKLLFETSVTIYQTTLHHLQKEIISDDDDGDKPLYIRLFIM
jgi:hypothetical protein